MYQTYPSQASHPGSMGVGVSAQAIGVAQQAQYLQPGQAASQRVPISHTTRASPVTVSWLYCIILLPIKINKIVIKYVIVKLLS